MKKFGVVLLCTAAGVFSLLYYCWTQATELPEWYTSQGRSGQNLQNPGHQDEVKTKVLKEKIDQEIKTNLRKNQNLGGGKNVEVKLNEDDVNYLLTSEIAKNSERSKILKAVKGANTTIESGKVKSGIVANLENIPTNELVESEKLVLMKLIEAFPYLKNKEVYIGIVGKPELESNKLKLDQNTEITVGNLTFPLSELSKKLNIPQSELEKSISLEFGKLKVNHVEFVGNTALVKGSVKEKL